MRLRPAPLQFGMYRWEKDGSQKRTPHKSVALLKQWYERLPGRVAQLLRERRKARGAAAEGAGGEAAAEMESLLQAVAA